MEVSRLLGWWQTGDAQKSAGDMDLAAQVNAAYGEWQAAEQHFQFVSDPELVDQAIYAMEAAQKKYSDLLHQLRETRTSVPKVEG